VRVRVKTKNGKPRIVYLPGPVVKTLRTYPRGLDRPGERVFRFRKGGRVYKLLRQAAPKAGVKLPERQAFHLFRYTFGACVRRYGGADTRSLVGTGVWDDRRCAERYAHVVVSEEAMRADRLPAPNLPPLLVDQCKTSASGKRKNKHLTTNDNPEYASALTWKGSQVQILYRPPFPRTNFCADFGSCALTIAAARPTFAAP
jgi:hypothetical protein